MLRRVIALQIAVVLLITLSVANPTKSQEMKTPPFFKDFQATAEKLVSQHMSGDFATSVRMKESVDFLLTPALMVQEAISDDVVMTYPTE